MKRILLITIPFFAVAFLNAQSINDAIRYSMFEVGGTARTVGVGGAIGALGADFSVLSTNPAGLGAYRRSEFVFTPSLLFSNVTSNLENGGAGSFDRDKTNFNFNNAGFVLSSRPLSSSWHTANFAIGFNRTGNFNQSFFYEGTTQGSITDRFLELADGLAPNDLDGFEAGLAFDALAIFNPGQNQNTFYVNDFQPGEQVDKSQLVRRKGSVNELVLSFGGNYKEKLMVGATVGIPFLNFEETKTYTETDKLNQNPVFNELTFGEKLKTDGVGVNFKFGLIYKLNKMLRFGAAVHTPTYYNLNDKFSTTLSYDFTDPNVSPVSEQSSPEGNFDYKIRTPWRLIGSAALLVKKHGFVSAEVEWLDYGSANFNFNNSSSRADIEFEQDLNNQVDNQLGTALNVRLGGEFVYELYRFRAGFNISESPYKGDNSTNSAFSLGAGIREKTFYIDVAYKRAIVNTDYIPYVAQASQQLVKTEDERNKLMMTVGVKF